MGGLKKVEKEFITNILIGFVDSHTNIEGIVPTQYEDTETLEEVGICKDILEKLNRNNGGIKLKKAFQLFIFTLSLLIFSSNVNTKALSFNNTLLNKYVTDYKELQQVAVDKNKEFTINFNKEINKLSINRNTVKVLDSKGQEVNVSVVTRIDNDKVAIVRPNQSYTEGETYALIVTKGVTDTNNKSLNKEIVLKFTIKSTAVDPGVEEPKMSEDEQFFKSIIGLKTWSGNFSKIVGDKLYFNYYDYTTQKTIENVSLSTIFNPNINRQTIDVFKSLYTPKDGYRTEITYSVGNNNTGLAIVEFYGKELTVRGDAFADFMFFDSSKSTDNKASFIVSIQESTKQAYENNSYRIKNALGAALNSSYSDQIFNYIDSQYKNTVLSGKNNYIIISKNFGNFKVNVYSYNKSLYAEIIKL